MMEKDIEIEIHEEQQEPNAGTQLPLNFLLFGELESDDVRVYIKQSTYKALEKLAASDTTKELGSILIGQYSQEMGKTHVVISDYIEAKYTDASASTLTFTHETWDYVHKEHESRYPNKKIIGWQHTHPNYGIFLSNYDLFIQENFFNMPFQIAYVIDPIQNLRGFFQWKNGKIEKLKGYYIYDEIGKPIKIEQTKRKTEQSRQPAKQSRAASVFLALLCVATVILAFCVFSLHGKLQAHLASQETILEQLKDQNGIIAAQADTITQLQAQLGDGQTTVKTLLAMIEDNALTIQNQEVVIRDLQALVEHAGEETGESGQYIHFISYTVAPGDTLGSICQANGIDYQAYRNIILAVNGMADANLLYAGQTLLLPVSEAD